MKIFDSKKQQIRLFAQEFRDNYLLAPKGQLHLSMYEKEKVEVQHYWEVIKQNKSKGNNYQDDVLEKLLPYQNTPHNREKGYRISVMPAITKDLKVWFENAGWQKAENWPKVGEAIFELVYDLIENGNPEALPRFEAKAELSKGIKAGFISPTLFFLNQKYRIINYKTIQTVNYILDQKAIDRDLTNYLRYVSIIDDVVNELEIDLFNDPEKFDMFGHFMCTKNLGGYAVYYSKVAKPTDMTEEVQGHISIMDNETEPSGHWEAIYYIVQAGKLLGYKTYVADPSREAFGTKLGEIADLKEVPPILKTAPEIHRVDAIWYAHKPPFFLFEVEDGGTMREALHRLYNAMAFDARFFVVCPKENHEKYLKWVTTAPFKEYEDRYNFRTYEELFDFYQEAKRYFELRGKFLRL